MKVLDQNDNSPQFSTNFYTVVIDEDTYTESQTITQLTATDSDQATNANIVYSLTGFTNTGNASLPKLIIISESVPIAH